MGLREVKRGYRNNASVNAYDHRFSGLRGKLNNSRVLRTLRKAYGEPNSRNAVIDVPCGTGRLQRMLHSLAPSISIQADISLEMLQTARKKDELSGGCNHYIQCDVTSLPFRDKVFQAAFNVRFMQHLEPSDRIATLKELKRVSDKLIVCYYHKYTFKTISRTLRRWLGLYHKVLKKASRTDLRIESSAAGLEIEKVRSVIPFFSDNWVVEFREAKGRLKGENPETLHPQHTLR